VVIVNYRQWENTAALARQLGRSACLRRERAEVVIVDNHSPPHPLARRLRQLPGVSLRRWGRNRGFASGVNEGWRLSRGRWLLLLNPDVSVPAGFLDAALTLARRLDRQEPGAGIVGFALRNGDGSRQLSAGAFPTLARTLAGLLRPRARRKCHDLRVRRRCEVDWVTGCCLLVRRECLEELDGLDEDFFLYYEDVDLCLRARARGWSVWYDPSLEVVHHQPLHARAVPPALRLVTRHSLLTYARKHWPRWQVPLLAGIVGAEALARRAWAWWRGDGEAGKLFRELGALTGELARGHWRAARRRLDEIVVRCPLSAVASRLAVSRSPTHP
jgi:N-acetylglucosaminyl-diphospho-decaprenol L-rhamnosyltransferase